MPKLSRPRKGSLQFYPRKRAARFVPGVNWRPISSSQEGFLGFIAYKVRMASAVVKDKTDKSMTQNKKLTVPVTILETPSMKILSVRFYKNGNVLKEVVVSNDKELKRKVKVVKTPKDLSKMTPKPEEYDDIRAILYSMPKQTTVKKTPDIVEVAIKSENKLDFISKYIGKEITLDDFLKEDFNLLDVRGVTKGKGTQGPVKRFGITLRFHKSEKGVRKVGSIAPWHPARVTFRTPMAGQMGLFTRVHYNLKVISKGKISEGDINPPHGFKDYGKIKSNYLVVKGSVQGPTKRQVVLTPSMRKTKKQDKKSYEFQELIVK